VIDGPLRNARVCLDVNGNGGCDSGEPSGVTDAGGGTTLTVPNDLLGKHPLVAVAGTDAVDADFGPVTQAYTMAAPADKTAVVSPLTTLAKQLIQASGLTSEAADAQLKAAGLAVSAYQNYVASRATQKASADAGLVAATVAATLQQQTAAVGGAIGKSDPSGAVVTRAEVESQIRGATLLALPDVVSTVTESAVQEACKDGPAVAACKTQLQMAASTTVQAIGLTEAGVLALAAATRNPDRNETTTGTATASFRWLSYGGSPTADWYYRVHMANAQEDTAVNGQKKWRNVRLERLGGNVREWNFSRDYNRRDDQHWNGSAWVSCPDASFQHTAGVRDAAGRATYDYCNGRELGSAVRSSESIAGRKLADVVKRIRAFPGEENGVPYSRWGDPLSGPPLTDAQIDTLFGNVVFPANAALQFQTTTRSATAISYDVRASNRVFLFSAAEAAGGDARSGATPPCSLIPAGALPTNLATRIEDLFIVKGTPCQLAPAPATADYQGSGPLNEAWGVTTLSLGRIGNVSLGNVGLPLPAPYATGNRMMRVAFTGNTIDRKTSYYSCIERRRDGSTRNCVKIGEGTYEVASLADARVMSFSGLPSETAVLAFERVFVERNGAVYFGYKDKPLPLPPTIRLNLEAANAVLQQLGLAALVP
jgi:hypothetical protein